MTRARHIVRLLLLGAAIVAGTTASAQEAGTRPAPRVITTPLGSAPQEVLLSKITVSDLAKSYQFYTRIIGLKRAFPEGLPIPPEPAPLAPGAQEPAFIEVAMNFSGSLGDGFFDITTRRGSRPAPETARLTTIGFKVPDAPAVIGRARAAGYEVVRDAAVVGPGEMSIGMIRDPDGYLIEIIQAASYPARRG